MHLISKSYLMFHIFKTLTMYMTRNSDQILNGFGALATAAGLAEVAENMNVLKDRSSDLIMSTTRMGKDVSVVSSMKPKLDECSHSLALVTDQLNSQRNMIVDALKVSFLLRIFNFEINL